MIGWSFFFDPILRCIFKLSFMKRFFAFLLLLSVNQLFAYQSTTIFGVWMSEENDYSVEIYASGSEILAKIHWVNTQKVLSTLDVYNSDPALRSRPLTGLIIWREFRMDNNGRKWKNGRIYNFHNGNFYNAKLSIADDGRLELYGFWWFLSMFGKSKYFHKVQ